MVLQTALPQPCLCHVLAWQQPLQHQAKTWKMGRTSSSTAVDDMDVFFPGLEPLTQASSIGAPVVCIPNQQ